MEPRHPTEARNLNELERTLWRLRMVAHEAQVMLRGFNRYPDAAAAINEDLWFGLTHQSLIILSKFLEIWHDFGSLARTDARVIPTRKALAPIVKRMRVWKGLDQFRNTTLAHAYLSKDGKLVPPWELQQKRRAPTFHAEVVLLLNLVPLAVLAVLSVFEKEYSPLDPLMGPSGPVPGPGPGISLGTELDAEIKTLAVTTDAALKAGLNVVVTGTLAAAFQEATWA